MSRPHLSFVATARNDDHGGRLQERMQAFVGGVLQQCKRYDLHAELLLVEWNPPAERPKLADVLKWEPLDGPCSVRIVEVPHSVHSRLAHSDRLPLYQMIAKNVGIRRARGDFVLATNIDILFNDALVRFMRDGLRKNAMYRVDRYDVATDIPEDAPIEEQLAWCERNIIRINDRDGTLDARTGHKRPIHPSRLSLSHVEREIVGRAFKGFLGRARLHTNACGDFTLMAREHWDAVQAYAEFQMYSMHIDSLLCHAAHHAGAREVVLPGTMRAYHIEHGVGSGWTPEGERALNQRLARVGIPQLDFRQFDAWATQMRVDDKPRTFNDADWGFANERLPETTITGK